MLAGKEALSAEVGKLSNQNIGENNQTTTGIEPDRVGN
ncbi:MAG: hypothetical protein ACD_39C01978G0001, partial [uncultured bacterium]